MQHASPPTVATTPSSSSDTSTTAAWLAVVALALSAFIFNTTEFVPVGLLSDISADFSMRVARTGTMITIYAWIVTAASLPMMLATRNMERKKLLLGTFVLFIACHALSGVAWSFPVLMISRLGVALAHAVFWSITVSLAVRVAPAGKQAQALSLLSTGTVLAMVVGVPLGRVLGQQLGWRVTFLAIGALAVLTLVVLARVLPRLPSQRAGSLASLPVLARRAPLRNLYVLILLLVTAHFTAYSYIEPFVQNVAHMSNGFTTAYLLLFGGAGVLGSLVFSRYGARHPELLITGAVLTLAVSCALLLKVSDWQLVLMLLGVAWGMSIMVVGLGMQAKVLETVPDATDVAMSLFSGIYNVGIGGGALLGGQVSLYLGMQQIGYVAGLVGSVALLWSLFTFRRQLCLRARFNRAVGRTLASRPA